MIKERLIHGVMFKERLNLEVMDGVEIGRIDGAPVAVKCPAGQYLLVTDRQPSRDKFTAMNLYLQGWDRGDIHVSIDGSVTTAQGFQGRLSEMEGGCMQLM